MLNKEQIKTIIEMRNSAMTNAEIANKLGVQERAVYYWTKKLKEAGHSIPDRKAGRKPIDLS